MWVCVIGTTAWGTFWIPQSSPFLYKSHILASLQLNPQCLPDTSSRTTSLANYLSSPAPRPPRPTSIPLRWPSAPSSLQSVLQSCGGNPTGPSSFYLWTPRFISHAEALTALPPCISLPRTFLTPPSSPSHLLTPLIFVVPSSIFCTIPPSHYYWMWPYLQGRGSRFLPR